MYPTNTNMKTIPIEDLINNRHPNFQIQYTKPLYGLSGEFKLNKEEWLSMITKHLQILNETSSIMRLSSKLFVIFSTDIAKDIKFS